MRLDFEIWEHTADVGIRLARRSRPQLFCDAGLAMFRLMIPEGDFTAASKEFLRIKGDDDEQLMVNWLSALNYLFQTRQFVPVVIKVKMTERLLTAELLGDTFDPQRHQATTEIKAVTYHMLQVQRQKGWSAQILFDI